MILLDTNVISELMRPQPDPRVRDWLLGLEDHSLGTTTITLSELEYGLQRLPESQRRKELQARLDLLLQALPMLPLDESAAREAARLRVLREMTGLAAHTADMMIGGIAAAHGATLATRNSKDFAGLPIKLIDPWSADKGV